MYQRKRQTWFKHLDFILLDEVSLLIAFFLSYYQYYHTLNLLTDRNYRNMLMVVLFLDFLVSIAFNTMHNVLRRGYYVELVQVLKQALLVLTSATLLMFAFKMSIIYSRLILAFTAVYHCLFGYLLRILWKCIINQYGLKREKRSMLLVCCEESVERVLSRSQPADDAGFSGIVLTDRDGEGETFCGLPVVANIENAARYICREWVDEVFFYPDSMSELERPEKILENLTDMGKSVKSGTGKKTTDDIGTSEQKKIEEPENFVALLLEQCRIMAIPVHIRIPINSSYGKNFLEKVNGFNVLTTVSNYASPMQLLFKRLIDIIGGIVGSIIALLIMVVVGPIIRRESPGPILFRQERIGLNGKRFKILKIRSMHLDAEERKNELMDENRVSDGMMFKLDFDPRIIGNEILPDGTKKTGIGEFIRRTSLDEFPQFFNVLKGDMSLVGTRPPTVDEWEKYEYHHRARLSVRPGITGMWQVSGRSKITDFEEVVALDTEYLNNWSIGLDIKILCKTVVAVFRKDGAM